MVFGRDSLTLFWYCFCMLIVLVDRKNSVKYTDMEIVKEKLNVTTKNCFKLIVLTLAFQMHESKST